MAPEAIACHHCGRLIPPAAVKCPYCSAAFQPAHVAALTRGAWIGLLLGLPLLALLALCGILLLWLR